MSPAGELPKVIECGQRMRVGGRFDTVTLEFVGPCKRWRVWLVGEKQAAILREYIDGTTKTRNRLLYSAEGAGKSFLMAQTIWVLLILAAQAGTPGALGATAPTGDRLGTLIGAVSDLGPVDGPKERNPNSWGTHFADARELRTVAGQIVQYRSTKHQSGATGSPVQGYTWNLGAAMDEGQDQVEQGAYEDVVARLRGGKSPPIIATATAKDSPAWRNWRDSLSNNWTVERLLYSDTPFVHAAHWKMLKQECSQREWQRRALAMDVGPERMVYHAWSRADNIRPKPQIGASDVTRMELSHYGSNIDLLIGHDPGNLFDVSVFLKAYQIKGEVHWWIVGELTTEQSTTEDHAVKLMAMLRERWGLYRRDLRGRVLPGSKVALIRADPTGNVETKPDQTVYTTLRNHGFDVRPAAYAPVRPNQTSAPRHGRIGQEARIEMINTLLCDANGRRRLYVDVDDRGAPVARKVVESIELSERDGDGRAENQRKNRQDMSHWTASLGYALWSIEKPRLRAHR